MKTSALLLTLFLAATACSAQYFVVKTVDKVYADNVLLAPRSEVTPEAKLRFSSAKAYAHVLSPTKGHFILSGRNGRKNARGEFFAALKEALVPRDEFLAAATRSSRDTTDYRFADQYDLKAFFRDRVVLLDSFHFRFASELFPLDASHYFVLRFRQKRKVVEWALPQSGTLVTIPPQVPKVRRKKRRPEPVAELVYRNAATATDEVFATFTLQVLSAAQQAQLREEVRLIYDRVERPSLPVFWREHLQPYLSMNYGRMPVGDARTLLPAEAAGD